MIGNQYVLQVKEIVLDFDLSAQTAAILALLKKYRDYDTDLADASIVRMTELTRDCRVLTLDRANFAVYHRNGRDLIPVIVPPARE